MISTHRTPSSPQHPKQLRRDRLKAEVTGESRSDTHENETSYPKTWKVIRQDVTNSVRLGWMKISMHAHGPWCHEAVSRDSPCMGCLVFLGSETRQGGGCRRGREGFETGSDVASRARARLARGGERRKEFWSERRVSRRGPCLAGPPRKGTEIANAIKTWARIIVRDMFSPSDCHLKDSSTTFQMHNRYRSVLQNFKIWS